MYLCPHIYICVCTCMYTYNVCSSVYARKTQQTLVNLHFHILIRYFALYKRSCSVHFHHDNLQTTARTCSCIRTAFTSPFSSVFLMPLNCKCLGLWLASLLCYKWFFFLSYFLASLCYLLLRLFACLLVGWRVFECCCFLENVNFLFPGYILNSTFL